MPRRRTGRRRSLQPRSSSLRKVRSNGRIEGGTLEDVSRPNASLWLKVPTVTAAFEETRGGREMCNGSRGTFPILSRHPSFYKTTQNVGETAIGFEKNDG